jgi:hypothetical protein
VTAFGQTKGLVAWTQDRRCKVGPAGLASRLDKGIDPELAITVPPYALPAALGIVGVAAREGGGH